MNDRNVTNKNGQLTLTRFLAKNARMNSCVKVPPQARIVLLIGAYLLCTSAFSQEKTNYFNDPFERVTSGLVGCPVPEGPMISAEQARSESHYRTERGTSCYQSGRCRLPNSYLYDKEIIPRVKQFILEDGRFSDTSIWVVGQRRWVTLRGCVNSDSQSQEIERSVKGVDDVEVVVNELKIMQSSNPIDDVQPKQ